METNKEQPKKELNQVNRQETNLILGDIQIQTFEDIDVVTKHVVWLLENKDVKEYLDVLEKKRKIKEVGYAG